jgi:hypothetical protein
MTSPGTKSSPDAPTPGTDRAAAEEDTAPRASRPSPLRAGRAVAAVVSFTATVVGLVFVLIPSLKPEGPAAEKDARLSVISFEDNRTFGQYLDVIDHKGSEYGPAYRRRRGTIVIVGYSIHGYKSKALPLRWRLVDADSGDQVGATKDRFIKAEANVDRGSWPLWVQIPRGRTRRFYIDVQIYNDRGAVAIHSLHTRRFRGS